MCFTVDFPPKSYSLDKFDKIILNQDNRSKITPTVVDPGQKTSNSCIKSKNLIDKSLIEKTVEILLNKINQNEDLEFSNQYKTQKNFSFYNQNIPLISLKKFIERIIKYTQMEKSSLIITLIYLERICQINSDLLLIRKNIFRIFFASTLLALKNNEDEIYSNSYYSNVAGISLEELNLLEYEFIALIKFDFHVSQEIYEKYESFLEM